MSQGTQRDPHPFYKIGRGKVAALVGDAQGGQSEAGGGDAPDFARVLAVGQRSILDQSGEGMGGLPKIANGSSFQVVKKRLIFGGKGFEGSRLHSWDEVEEDDEEEDRPGGGALIETTRQGW